MNTHKYYHQITFVLDLSLTTLFTKAELEEKLDSKLKENDENVEEQEKVAEEFKEAVASDSPNLADSANEVLDWAEYIQEQQDEILALAELLGNSFFSRMCFLFFYLQYV